jgi:hypothetical protein
MQVSAEGNLARIGNAHVAVDRLSAVHRGSESRFPINKDHSNLVKFSENDPNYHVVASYLREIAESLESQEPTSSSVNSDERADQDLEAPPGPLISYHTNSGSLLTGTRISRASG